MRTKLTPSIKIAMGWSVIIAVGLSGFVVARDSVIKNRKAIMDVKQRIRNQAQKEGEAKFLTKSQSGQSTDISS